MTCWPMGGTKSPPAAATWKEGLAPAVKGDAPPSRRRQTRHNTETTNEEEHWEDKTILLSQTVGASPHLSGPSSRTCRRHRAQFGPKKAHRSQDDSRMKMEHGNNELWSETLLVSAKMTLFQTVICCGPQEGLAESPPMLVPEQPPDEAPLPSRLYYSWKQSIH